MNFYCNVRARNVERFNEVKTEKFRRYKPRRSFKLRIFSSARHSAKRVGRPNEVRSEFCGRDFTLVGMPLWRTTTFVRIDSIYLKSSRRAWKASLLTTSYACVLLSSLGTDTNGHVLMLWRSWSVMANLCVRFDLVARHRVKWIREEDAVHWDEGLLSASGKAWPHVASTRKNNTSPRNRVRHIVK